MPTYYSKPENALNRANEFISVGKQPRALEALVDVMKSKKHRTWQKTHEAIMDKYMELCVDLRKSHLAKEGLYQYKNICQQVNVKSLEDVVRRYLLMAEDRTEAAKKESHQSVVDIEDLDILQTPESLLLNSVSGEDAQDRSDRAILTPWVKFLWESYRQCLELLRNNYRVERLYQDVAQLAFKFCLKYARKTEFRKLCDNLRMHLNNAINKSQGVAYAISLTVPETLQSQLEIRLSQLDCAISMELWQEAFKAVEDIHNLIAMSKKPPRPSLMANYYSKFALVLWKSNNQLFHAATWHRLYILNKEQRKNVSAADLQKLSNCVLCATLAIPLPPSRYMIDQLLEPTNEVDKRRRLAALLDLPAPPTRASLIKDLLKNKVLQYVSPELKHMYAWLEVDFHPLKLSGLVHSCVDYIQGVPELSPYVGALQEITVVRLIKQVSQVYETIQFSRLAELAPFVDKNRLESVIVQAAKNIDLPVRINHREQTLSFGTDLSSSLQEEVREGPSIQLMPGERIRNQLQHMALALTHAMGCIGDPEEQEKEEEFRRLLVNSCRKHAAQDHKRTLLRKPAIEERKETMEKITERRLQKEKEEELARERELRQQEEERLKKEMAEREKQRDELKREEVKRQVIRERVEQLRKTDAGERALAGLAESDLAGLDADTIMAKQVEQLEKEKRELADRLRLQEKKVDHFARAKIQEELDLLRDYAHDKTVENRDYWETYEADKVASLIQKHKDDISNRDRLRGMAGHRAGFMDTLRQVRQAEHVEALKAFEAQLDEERKQRLDRRRLDRIQKRRERARIEKEREAERIEEERQLEEAMKAEEAERKREEEQERLAMQQEKQRQREREIEEKLEREKAEARERAEARMRERERESGGGQSGAWRPSRGFGTGPERMETSGGDDSAGWRRGTGVTAAASTPGRDGGGSSWRSRDESSRMDIRERPGYDDRQGYSRGSGRDDRDRYKDDRDRYGDRGGRRDDRDRDRYDRDRYGGGGRDDRDRSYRSGGREDWDRGGERRDERSRYGESGRDDRSREYGRRDDGYSGRRDEGYGGRRDDGYSSRRDEGRRDERDYGHRSEEGSWSRDGGRGRDGPSSRGGEEQRGGGSERWRRSGEDDRPRDSHSRSAKDSPQKPPGTGGEWETVGKYK